MKVVYASRNGHVESIVNRLEVTDVLRIVDGTEKVDEDYVIFTYTDGNGMIPKNVETFLAANPGVKAVVGSGSLSRHPNTFNFAADKISEQYNVPILCKVDMEGNKYDISQIKAGMARL